MKLWNSYFRATTVEDALLALAEAGGPALPIAGGTDLLLDLQQGRHAPVERLVDVSGIAEMRAIEIRGAELYIGAAAPINQIVRSPLVAQHALAVVEACDLIGGPQVRNTATLGGNVGHALPAADGTIALVAMGAEAEVASLAGNRRLPLTELFLGPGKSRLETGKELLAGFYLPLRQPGEGSAFRRVMRPQGVALPILNMAAWMRRNGDEILAARLAVGPSGPTPRRSVNTETVLLGRSLDGATLSAALEALLAEAQFRTSPRRASGEYRRFLAAGLLKDVLETAYARAAE
jgi:carbon-monoxide dehydrogenase medium subunit